MAFNAILAEIFQCLYIIPHNYQVGHGMVWEIFVTPCQYVASLSEVLSVGCTAFSINCILIHGLLILITALSCTLEKVLSFSESCLNFF